jgi:hypothetical protein
MSTRRVVLVAPGDQQAGRGPSPSIPHKPGKVVVYLPGKYPLSQQEPIGNLFYQCPCEQDNGPCAAVLEEPSN